MDDMKWIMIKTMREMNDLTQAELAQRADVSVRLISALETGTYASRPGDDVLRRIGEVLCPEEPDFLLHNGGRASVFLKALEQDKGSDPLLVNMMKELADVTGQRVVDSVFSRWSGYVRGMPSSQLRRDISFSLAEAMAEIIQSAKFIGVAQQEMLWRDLVVSIEGLMSDAEKTLSMEDALQRLRQSRITNNLSAREEALRAAFFAAYDSWSACASSHLSSYVLCDIVCLMEWPDTPSNRQVISLHLYRFAMAVSAHRKGHQWM